MLGPVLVVLGWSSLSAADAFNRIMGGVCIAFGLYYALKPLLAAWLLTRRRRASGAADLEIAVTFGEDEIVIEQGDVRSSLGWDAVVQAGRGRGYLWYELRGGSKATVPLRAVDDIDALEARFRDKTRWVG